MSEEERVPGVELGQVDEKQAAEWIGRTLGGRYKIDALMATGGLALVFRGTRISDGEAFAIKVLRPDAEGLPELVERFEREAIAGKHILHPNVAAVHEIERLDDGSWFLIQDLVRGETLRDLIDRGPVVPLRAARIARQVAAGLVAAHDMGIVHRDIKPRNLMVAEGAELRVQIVDFGLAKVPVERLALVDDARRSLTQAGVVFGTVAYLAPEAALGMRSVDRRSDLYALGLVLYELLAGQHPFTASNPVEMFKQQRHAPPPPIAERSPGVDVPPVLEAVVMRLLDKDPDERYQHARAVMVALDAAIEQMDQPLRPLPTRYAEKAPSVPRWRAVVLALLAAALVAAILVFVRR